MGRWSKFRRRLLSGHHDRNTSFADLIGYLEHLGFTLRVRGDHHILTSEDMSEIVNLQPLRGDDAKPYQVRQVRGLVVRYRLGEDDDEV